MTTPIMPYIWAVVILVIILWIGNEKTRYKPFEYPKIKKKPVCKPERTAWQVEHDDELDQFIVSEIIDEPDDDDDNDDNQDEP